MKYRVQIIETLGRTIEIEAESDIDATAIIADRYNNEEIILNADDFQNAEIEVMD